MFLPHFPIFLDTHPDKKYCDDSDLPDVDILDELCSIISGGSDE